MRTDLAEFWRIVEEASWVRTDPTGQYYLVRHPELGWRLYQRGIEAAFLLAREEEALFWAPEFRVPLPVWEGRKRCPMCGGTGWILVRHSRGKEEMACVACVKEG